MAIISCPECYQPVSNQAVFCPRCGYSIAPYRHPAVTYWRNRQRNRILIFLAIMVAPVVLLLIAYALLQFV